MCCCLGFVLKLKQPFFAVYACAPVVQCLNVLSGPTSKRRRAHLHVLTPKHTSHHLQTPLAFPWADDLLGEFLRRLRQERKNRPWPKQEPKPEQASSHHQQQHQQGVRPGVKQEAPQELHPPADASVHLQGCQQSGLSNGIQGAHCNGSHQHSVSANGMCSMAQGNGVQGACQGKHSPQANG